MALRDIASETLATGASHMADTRATLDDVQSAYRLLLGREADPGGLNYYQEEVRNGTLTMRRLLWTFLNSTEFLTKAGTKVDLGGVFAVVDASEPEFGRHIARDATWEPHIVQTITANLLPGQVFIDVGANVGIMSFKAAQVVGPLGKVIAFEPNEENARFFLRGLLANEFQEFVRLYQFALSDKSSLFELRGGSNTSVGSTETGARLVQSIRGDEILASEPAIHFIKLDIEGHEPFALRGLSAAIKRHKPLVLCEFNPRCLRDYFGISQSEFAKEIFDLSHQVRVIEHNGKTSEIATAGELSEMWVAKDQEAVTTGFLPAGMLHFDLLFHANR